MGLKTEELVEFALVQAFPGQSQAQKQLYRFELEAMTPQALLQLGREVANSQDYQVLQRTVVLPVLSSKEINYTRFGPELAGIGRQASIDNGIVFGDVRSYVISSQKLTLSGSPLKVRSQFLEWQWINPNSASAGVLPYLMSDTELLTLTNWEVLLEVRLNGEGRLYANGVIYVNAFTGVEPGDIFFFGWDASGDLTITNYDANRTLKASVTVINGDVAVVATPAILMIGANGQITVGRIGTGNTPSLTPTVTDGLYRVDLQTGYNFLTSFLDETGMVQFDGLTRRLSWVPSLNYRGQAMRCDTWYWTLDGEQIVFWPGTDGEALPANSLRITGNIQPQAPDLPLEYHKRAIDILVEMAQVRAGMKRR